MITVSRIFTMFFCVAFLMLIVGIVGCDEEKYQGKDYEAEGIVIHVDGMKTGWVKNTTDFSFRVKFFEGGVVDSRGEETEWLKVLSPGEKVEVKFHDVPSRHGIYVYDARGGCVLGFARIGVSDEKAEKKSEDVKKEEKK